MENKAVGNGRNPYYEGQFDAEEPADTASRLSLVAERDRMKVQLEGMMFDALGEPRTRYVRVTLNGGHCVMHPSEGDCYVEDARNAGDPDWDRYVVRDVWLSEREFDDLPEHAGF